MVTGTQAVMEWADFWKCHLILDNGSRREVRDGEEECVGVCTRTCAHVCVCTGTRVLDLADGVLSENKCVLFSILLLISLTEKPFSHMCGGEEGCAPCTSFSPDLNVCVFLSGLRNHGGQLVFASLVSGYLKQMLPYAGKQNLKMATLRS